MSVHKDLAQHAKNQNEIYQQFLALDQLREQYIEEVVQLCKQGSPFSTDEINKVTDSINKLSLRFIPTRKCVTNDMIREYVNTL